MILVSAFFAICDLPPNVFYILMNYWYTFISQIDLFQFAEMFQVLRAQVHEQIQLQYF